VRQTVIFLCVSLVIALIGFVFVYKNKVSLNEMWLEQQNTSLTTEWQIIGRRIDNVNKELALLADKDDNNYRVILDSSPLSGSIRTAGTGGSERLTDPEIHQIPFVYDGYSRLEKLKNQSDVALQSFKELEKLFEQKTRMWASRPAIQPIDNRQLDRLHLSFGLRLHPIFNILMDHKGLDFSAPKGTPVYSTGDGKVIKAYYSDSYGKVIYINHGFGYETRYAHLSDFAVAEGESIKRGQVIGYVGSTGNSVSSHLHYEVLFNDVHINPINFFQRDLNNSEYERLIQSGAERIQPLD
jgi:murein DD-endopeptidase MepM/ murein hydrolase activator NlpD